MKRNKLAICLFAMLITAAVTYIVWDGIESEDAFADTHRIRDYIEEEREDDYKSIEIDSESDAREVISIYADNHNYSEDDYPYYMITKMADHPELRDFILEYPAHKNEDEQVFLSDISITEDIEKASGVPLFLQWDQRWGYRIYGSDLMGFTGCGPTCLAMVATYLLNNTYMTPAYIAQFSMDNGFYDYENQSGTFWSLMYDGANMLGLCSEEVPGETWAVQEHLENGEPIIAIMGPGDFTSEGHFIVLTSYSDGYVTVNDPNSIERSSKKWELDEIMPQIQGMWAYSV